MAENQNIETPLFDSGKNPLLNKQGEKLPLLSSGKHRKSVTQYSSFVNNGHQEIHKAGKKKTYSKTGMRLMALLILTTELCERLTFYSINGNLVLYLTNYLQYSSPDASTISLVFQGACYCIPLFGGIVADAIAGKYNTIYGSGLIYIVGTFLLPVVAYNFNSIGLGMGLSSQRAYYLCGLTLVAIGTGGIKANCGPFGAEQVEEGGPAAVQSFFNWFYWFVNIGSAIAQAAVAYIQQEISFFIGYVIPACSILLSLLLFTCGRGRYKHKPIKGSAFSKVANIISQGIKPKSKSLHRVNSWLDRAKVQYGGNYTSEKVEDVKKMGRIIVMMLCIILFNVVYAQSSSSFLIQAVRMNLSVGSFKFPAASLLLFDSVIVLLLVPIMDRLIYPCLKRLGRSPTQLQRIGIGLVLSAFSAAAAGLLEHFRKQDIAATGGFMQNVGGVIYQSSYITVFAQVPQYALLGASEVFTNIAAQEYVYSQSPEELRGLMMGIYQFVVGIGNFVGSALVNLVNIGKDPWYPNEINNGHLDWFYYILVGLMALNFIIYLIVTTVIFKNKPNNIAEQDTDQREKEQKTKDAEL